MTSPSHWRPRWTYSLWCLSFQFSCNYFLLIVSWHSHNMSPASLPKRCVWFPADKTLFMKKLKGYRKEQKGKVFTKNLPDSSVPSMPSTFVTMSQAASCTQAYFLYSQVSSKHTAWTLFQPIWYSVVFDHVIWFCTFFFLVRRSSVCTV